MAQKPKHLEVLNETDTKIVYKTTNGVKTIYNKTDKTINYYADYRRPKGSKQRFNRQKLSSTNLKDAKDEINELKKLDKKSITNTKLNKSIPLSEAYKQTILSSHKVKESDFDDYTKYAYHTMQYFNNHLKPLYGNRQIGRITDADLENMGAILNDKGLSQSVLNDIKGVLKRTLVKYTNQDLFVHVNKSAWTATNYDAGVEFSLLINRANLTPLQIQQQLLKELINLDISYYRHKQEQLRHIKTVIKLAMATGRRIKELIHTPIQNIDFATGAITVYAKTTKTSINEVYLAPVELLQELKNNKHFDPTGTIGIFIQTNTYSKHYKKCLKKVLKATGEEMNGKAIHRTRSLLVSTLTQLGTDATVADALLSHTENKSILLTYNITNTLLTTHKQILEPCWKQIGLIHN